MTEKDKLKFRGGINIAMKIPSHLYTQTVTFYRDVLQLPLIDKQDTSVVFQFGTNRLWLDRVEQLSQAEIWLEVVTEDVSKAAQYFDSKEVTRRDEIEVLPEGFEGFWVSKPANIIHLISKSDEV